MYQKWKIVKNVKDNTTYEGKRINQCDSHINGKWPLVQPTVGSLFLSL